MGILDWLSAPHGHGRIVATGREVSFQKVQGQGSSSMFLMAIQAWVWPTVSLLARAVVPVLLILPTMRTEQDVYIGLMICTGKVKSNSMIGMYLFGPMERIPRLFLGPMGGIRLLLLMPKEQVSLWFLKLYLGDGLDVQCS